MGAFAQEPRHSTSRSVKRPSLLVSKVGQRAAVGWWVAQRIVERTHTLRRRGCGLVSNTHTQSPTDAPPSLMPRCFSIVSRISSAPFTMQGVVPQSWMNHLPTFSLCGGVRYGVVVWCDAM